MLRPQPEQSLQAVEALANRLDTNVCQVIENGMQEAHGSVDVAGAEVEVYVVHGADDSDEPDPSSYEEAMKAHDKDK